MYQCDILRIIKQFGGGMSSQESKRVSLEDLGIERLPDGEVKALTPEAELIMSAANAAVGEIEGLNAREKAMITFIELERKRYKDNGFLGVVFGSNEDRVLVYRHPEKVSKKEVTYLAVSRYGFCWMVINPEEDEFSKEEIKIINQAGMGELEYDDAKKSPILGFNKYLSSTIKNRRGETSGCNIYFGVVPDGIRVPRISPNDSSYGEATIGGTRKPFEHTEAVPATKDDLSGRVLDYLRQNEKRFEELTGRDSLAVSIAIGGVLGDTDEKRKNSRREDIYWFFATLINNFVARFKS